MAQVLLPAIVDFSNGLGWMGIFQKLWIRLLKIYDDLQGIKWRWQSLDSVTTIKAPLEGTRLVPIQLIEASLVLKDAY
jgi:hypothetical protein